MMKLRIKNFQALEDVDLEIDGFTVIVGRTNLGKSSIIRAIQGALNNKPGDSFVREGKTHCEVDIQCPEMTLNWKKGGGFNDYEIDGELLQSVGHGPPPHIATKGFRELELSREDVNVQIADQFHPVFLLDPAQTSGSSAAEVISDVGRLGEVQSALVKAGKDRRQKRSTEKVREQDLKQVNEELAFFDGLDDDLTLVEKAGDVRESCGQLSRQIDFFEKLSKKAETRKAQISYFDGINDIEIPSGPSDSGLHRIRFLENFSQRSGEAHRKYRRYSGISNIEIPDSSSVEALLDRCNKVSNWMSKVEGLNQTIEDCEQEIQRLDTDLSEARDHVHDVLVENGTCPVCEQEVE